LYTHTHADHLNGIDDLRNYCYLQKQAIPVFGNAPTINNIRQRFGYAFGPAGQYWDKPVLTSHVVADSFDFAGARITPIPLLHGRLPIFGYRINNIAYLTDLSCIEESSIDLLRGLDALFLDCLHYRPHRTHVHFDKALEYAQRISARETYLIHMTHQMEYGEASARLPAGVRLGCDGLRLYIDD
jgi:phosphoribosyl 1,2-cyclic phosphate phosphodiesterase